MVKKSKPMAAEDIPAGAIETYKPMAAPEPTLENRVEALELRLAVTEDWTNRHTKYHFGKVVKG